MTIILDQPWQMQMFGLLQLKHRLALEIKTGMKWRQSNISVINRTFGVKLTRKKQAYDFICGIIELYAAELGIAPPNSMEDFDGTQR